MHGRQYKLGASNCSNQRRTFLGPCVEMNQCMKIQKRSTLIVSWTPLSRVLLSLGSVDGKPCTWLHIQALVDGATRSSCPGNHYAEASLFIIVASILAVFDIKPTVDPVTGLEMIPEVKVLTSVLVR